MDLEKKIRIRNVHKRKPMGRFNRRKIFEMVQAHIQKVKNKPLFLYLKALLSRKKVKLCLLLKPR